MKLNTVITPSFILIFLLAILLSMGLMSSYEFGVGYFWYKKRGLQVPWIYKKFKDRKYRSVSAATKHYFFAWVIVGSVNFVIMRLIISMNLTFFADTVVSVLVITSAMISMEFSIGLFFFKLRGKEVPWVYVKFSNAKFRSISGVDRSYLTGWFILGIIHHFIFAGFFFLTDNFILAI